jgi:hypothetical protein
MKTAVSTSMVCALAIATLGFGSLAHAQDIRSP